MHAQTLDVNISFLHVDHKATKCTTCQQICGESSFSFWKPDSDQ